METRGHQSLLLALALAGGTSAAVAQGTAFNFQGRLTDNYAPATGLYDLWFAIYDAPDGGSQVGPTLNPLAQPVTNGLFSATLDFGPDVFTGPPRWHWACGPTPPATTRRWRLANRSCLRLTPSAPATWAKPDRCPPPA